MRITAKGIYAIRAIFDLAHHSYGTPVSLSSISKRQRISRAFLAQIFQLLRKGGIVRSVRGPKGGFILTQPYKEIYIGQVLRIVESPLDTISNSMHRTRMSGSKKIDECISNLLWRKLGEQILNLLDSTSFADLCAEAECPEDCTFIPPAERSVMKRNG